MTRTKWSDAWAVSLTDVTYDAAMAGRLPSAAR